MRFFVLLLTLCVPAVSAFASAREPVAVMPLQAGLGTPAGLGEAWAPLMAELLAERGKEPLYAPAMKLSPTVKASVAQCRSSACYLDIGAALGAKRLVAGGVTREGFRYFLTLTLHDLASFKQTARVERTWAGNTNLDRELGAALDDLFNAQTKVASAGPQQEQTPAQLAPAPSVQNEGAQTTAAINTTVDPAAAYQYRKPAIALTIVGALGVAGGAAMLVTNQLMLKPFQDSVAAYNTATIRTQAQFDQLSAQKNTLDGLLIGTAVAFGVGAAALTAGIVLFAIDKPRTVAFLPTGAGGMFVGSF
jgi:hypothetical protein